MKKEMIMALRDEEKKDYKVISKKDKLRAMCDHKKSSKDGDIIMLKAIPGEADYGRCKICGKKVRISPINIGELTEAIKLVNQAVECVKMGAEGLDNGVLGDLGDLILNNEQLKNWYTKQYLEQIAESNATSNNNYQSNGALRLNSELGEARGFHVSNPYEKHNHYKNKNHKNKHKNKNREFGPRSVADLARNKFY